MQKGYTGADRAIAYLFLNATKTEIDQILDEGQHIANVTIDGRVIELYAPYPGSSVSYTKLLQGGTRIGIITINGMQYEIYAPTPPTGQQIQQMIDDKVDPLGLSVVNGQVCQTYEVQT